LSQRLNRKPKANRSTDSNSLEATSRPNLQYELPFQKYMEQVEITLDRNPQPVVTLLVSFKPAPKDSSEVNKVATVANQQTGRPSSRLFTIHKDFLCFYSPFFASAFNGPYKEGKTQTMILDEIDLEAFGMFVYWLYQRKLPTHTVDFEDVDLVHLANIWILGDRFLIPSLQNNAACRIHTLINEGKLEDFQEFIGIAYGYRDGLNELAKLAVWTVIKEDQVVFDAIWQESGFPPAMALEIMRLLKTHYEVLICVKKLPMPPSDTFKVKEYNG
jgi:hypothetical protein